MSQYSQGVLETFQCSVCNAVTAHTLQAHWGWSRSYWFTCANCGHKAVEIDEKNVAE